MEKIHPRMKSIYDEYLGDLVATGVSENEAVRYLATIRDWSQNAFFPGLCAREDEYWKSADHRMKLAEDGLDFCEFWLRLQAGGASERQLYEFTEQCQYLSVQNTFYWLSCNDLTDMYICGTRIMKQGVEEVD